MDDEKCRRNGCTLTRGWRVLPDGRRKRRTACSHACVVWMARARDALQNGDANEATELLRIAAQLDRRTHPGQTVPGVFKPPQKHA
ncbi:hypothetical protein CP974_03065 [Streptomyces fradiae ATCC 10745 = DSM 40063]|nr:hypothetical protein CP974_03065 [Streptomyces fradiae ATCC 10745 = DSM 40063]